jgi:hypothetical protein
LLPGGGAGWISKRPFNEHPFPAEPISARWIEQLGRNELVLSWHVDNMDEAGVQYPFSFDPWPNAGPPYFTIQIALGDDYFSQFAENIAFLNEQKTKCSCGEQLAYEAGWGPAMGSRRIRRLCPKCGRTFDPSNLACEIQDGWTGEPQVSMGGANFRFALEVDCGKYFPHDEEGFRKFKPREEFLAFWRTHIGVPYEQVDTVG